MASIKVRAEGVRLNLHLPLGLCLAVARKALGSENEEFSRFLKANGQEIRRVLRQYKKSNGRLTLVDIQSSDGAVVKIKI